MTFSGFKFALIIGLLIGCDHYSDFGQRSSVDSKTVDQSVSVQPKSEIPRPMEPRQFSEESSADIDSIDKSTYSRGDSTNDEIELNPDPATEISTETSESTMEMVVGVGDDDVARLDDDDKSEDQGSLPPKGPADFLGVWGYGQPQGLQILTLSPSGTCRFERTNAPEVARNLACMASPGFGTVQIHSGGQTLLMFSNFFLISDDTLRADVSKPLGVNDRPVTLIMTRQ